MKKSYGLVKGVTPDVKTSLKVGLKILATKGFRGGITYNKETGTLTYNFQGWNTAVKNYNGGGNESYQDDVNKMLNGARDAKPEDYPVK